MNFVKRKVSQEKSKSTQEKFKSVQAESIFTRAKNKVIQAKIIATSKIADIGEKRERFYNEIRNIQFKLPQHMSVEKAFSEFNNSLIEELKEIFTICSKHYRENGKSKSDVCFNAIMENTNNLITSLRVVEGKTNNAYNSNVLSVLNMVHSNFNNLNKCFISVSKFGVSVSAVLDYGPTRKKFQELSKELRLVESAFKQLISQFNILNFIKIFEVIKSENDVEKFFKSRNKIRGFIYIIGKDYLKYEKVKIDYNFQLYESIEEKFFNLISYLKKFLKYLESAHFDVSAAKLKKLINEFDKVFKSLKTKEFECFMCCEKYSLKDAVILPCGHSFHKECIKEWLSTKPTCPECRTEVGKSELNSILN